MSLSKFLTVHLLKEIYYVCYDGGLSLPRMVAYRCLGWWLIVASDGGLSLPRMVAYRCLGWWPIVASDGNLLKFIIQGLPLQIYPLKL